MVKTAVNPPRSTTNSISTGRNRGILSDALKQLPTESAVDLDESFTEREAYQEGALSDEPDFSRYEDPTEEEDDG